MKRVNAMETVAIVEQETVVYVAVDELELNERIVYRAAERYYILHFRQHPTCDGLELPEAEEVRYRQAFIDDARQRTDERI